MKLLSYHIENYGKIHNQDGNFAEGLTVLCESNGYGKTTLASFIRAMFYGLPTYTTRTKVFDDRQHFYPFNGGKFGGNLTFELQGKTYKIERFFDKKSAKDDEVKVYCDGAPFTGFGEDIGKDVFGLDEESFKKTVFITADEIEIASTYSINEKLNRDVEGGEDNDFEAAMDVLEKAKKQLKAGRGSNDLISAKNAEVLAFRDRIKNLKDMSDSLTDEYVEREQLSKKIALMEVEMKTANEREVVLQKWKNFDSLVAQAEEKTAKLKGFEEKYPNGIPSAEECDKMRSCLQEESRLTGSLQAVRFGEDKEKLLADLTVKFQNGAPRDEDIAQKQQNLTRLAALKAEQNKLENTEQSPREREVLKRFEDKLPTEAELTEKRGLVEEYKQKDAQLKEMHASLLTQIPTQPTQAGKGKGFTCLGLSIVCMAAGVALCALSLIPAGIAAMAVGVIALIAGVALLAKKPAGTAVQSADITVQIAKMQGELKALEEKLRAFTVPYGYYGNAGVLYDFATLEEDVRAYHAQTFANKERMEKITSLRGDISAITSEVQAFLQGYGENGEDLQSGLNRLLALSAQYASLQADKAASSGKASDANARILQCKATVAEILKKYDLDENAGTMYALNAMEADGKVWAAVKTELAQIEEKLTTYKEENALTERPAEADVDTGAMHSELSILRKQLSDCDKRILETERDVEKLPDVESELECAEEVLKLYKEKHQLLSDTMDALKGAEKSLKDKYIAPIKDKFSVYAEALERVLDEKVTMDSDYRVKFERGGEERSDKHLSAGERSLCALCLRLALIDNMYPTEQPFIMMDDPFVHLDEQHLQRTVELVNELAKSRQIIYFCCHESRSMSHRI